MHVTNKRLPVPVQWINCIIYYIMMMSIEARVHVLDLKYRQ